MARLETVRDDGTIVIRASSTSDYPDCCRRVAAKLWPQIVASAGYDLRETVPSVGAAVGTSVHSAGEYSLRSKIDTGEIGNDNEAEDRAIGAFQSEIEHGVLWDQTTQKSDDAKRQIARMVKMYRRRIAPGLQPVAAEKRFEAEWRPGIVVSGQVDHIELSPQGPGDLKTGTRLRSYAAQLGSYSLLCKTHQRPWENARAYFLPRAPLSQDQPPPLVIDYDGDIARRTAEAVIDRMASDVEQFKKTGDPWSFPANPNSMLCSPQFCPAHGTLFCREHMGAGK